MNKKTVYFDYFDIWCHELTEDGETIVEKKFDITNILKKASELTPKETMRKYRDEKVRIQKVKSLGDIWEIQLLRLREKSLPGVAKDDGEFQLIVLDDGEYIGESVSLLYDKQDCVIVIQRNCNSISPSGVEEYFNSILHSERIKRIILKPIIAESELKKITTSKVYRSLTIGISMNEQIPDSIFLNNLLKNFKEYDGVSYKFVISVGRAKKDKSLSPGLSVDTIKELYDKKYTTILKTSIKDSEDTKVEKIDLLDDRRKDSCEFTIEKKKPLTHERVFMEMYKKYSIRKEENKIY